MFIWLGILNPNVFGYLGVDLVLGSAVPLVFAAVSQSLIIALGDIDLGVGFYIGLANAVVAVVLYETPALGLLYVVLLIAAYALMGALISFRNVSSITFTLGASFVWLGFARLIAPTPRASSPEWLASLYSTRPPLVPLAVWLICGAALVSYLLFFRTRVGLMIRSAGSNQHAFVANGGSLVRARAYGYALAGVFAVLAAVALTGVTRSADVTASADFTLLAIAAVILGSGSFEGGKASAVGVVAGAITFSVIGALMTQLSITSSLQTGARGLALVLVISGRRMLMRRST